MSTPSNDTAGAKGELTAALAQLEQIDARLQAAVSERLKAGTELLQAGAPLFSPTRDADTMRQIVERHTGDLSLARLEYVWRALINATTAPAPTATIHLDGGADLVEMLDLARYYFGFSAELLPGTDAEDVAGSVAASQSDLGIVALVDRADLPWWRGLSETAALVRGRLPFVLLDERPADLPALVLAKADSLVDMADVAVYDARWSDRLPGRLMDQGIEVLSFFRSANGIDALLAVSGELSEDDVIKACTAAGAEPDVLRCVGGYAAPIDGETDTENGFGPDLDDISGDSME